MTELEIKTLVIHRDSHGRYWVDQDFLRMLGKEMEPDSEKIVKLVPIEFDLKELRELLDDNKICAYCHLSCRGVCREGDEDCIALEKLKQILGES